MVVWKSHEETWTSTTQKDPSFLVDQIGSYVIHLQQLQKQFSFFSSNILAMDKTPFWNNTDIKHYCWKNWG